MSDQEKPDDKQIAEYEREIAGLQAEIDRLQSLIADIRRKKPAGSGGGIIGGGFFGGSVIG